MTDAKADQATSAVAVVDPQKSALAVLDGFPEDRFNRLIPTATVMSQANPFMVPQVAVVALDIERDTYESRDLKAGHRALGKTGLLKLSNIAAISVIEQFRSDDGTDPDAVEITTKIAMTLPTGQILTSMGVRRQTLQGMTPAQANRARMFLTELAASKSQLRAVRALLTLQQSYPKDELAKPWAVVHYVPNMADPEVRARMLDAMAPARAMLYGGDQGKPDPSVKMIDVGPAPDDDVVDADVRQETGEVEPTMFDGPEIPLLDRLATRAKAMDAEYPGAATDDQKQRLQDILAPLGGEDVSIVIFRAFDRTDLRITSAEAASILEASADDDFGRSWKGAAEAIRAKSNA